MKTSTIARNAITARIELLLIFSVLYFCPFSSVQNQCVIVLCALSQINSVMFKHEGSRTPLESLAVKVVLHLFFNAQMRWRLQTFYKTTGGERESALLINSSSVDQMFRVAAAFSHRESDTF